MACLCTCERKDTHKITSEGGGGKHERYNPKTFQLNNVYNRNTNVKSYI